MRTAMTVVLLSMAMLVALTRRGWRAGR